MDERHLFVQLFEFETFDGEPWDNFVLINATLKQDLGKFRVGQKFETVIFDLYRSKIVFNYEEEFDINLKIDI